MAESSPTVLAHVAWMLRGTFEDLSTEALAYILNRSDAATEAFRELLQQAGADISPIREAQTQVVEEGGERPDLVCLDGEGIKHVLMEAKFDALLTENQPVNYLRYLPKDRNSAPLVVAPRRRLEWLWTEMMQLVCAESDFTIGDERQGESVYSAPVGDDRTFMLTSWDHLLGLLETSVQADGDEGTLRSIAELQGVVDYENLNAFYAPSGKLSDLDDENKEKLEKLVYGAIEEGKLEGWADMTGYSSTRHENGYLRYFRMHDVSMWFGYDTRLWECLGGPLWLGFQCCCLAIPSMLTAERKCPHDGACEIDAARTGKTSGTQQLTGWIYDDGAGSDTDGTERTPYQAHTGGIQGEGSSRNSSRQQRSQPCQCYTEHTGDRSSTSGSDQIRRSQPHAPERVAEGARGYRHRSRHVTQDTD